MINILFMCYNRHIRRIFLIDYQSFKNAVLGKRIDIDGAYGSQCWDGAMYWYEKLGYPRISCTVSKYAKDIWIYRKTNGILRNSIEVSIYKPGDIVVFKEVPNVTPYSHIAIFDSDIDGKYGWFLGQNQGGVGGAFNLCKFPYSATYDTGFRPKCLVNQTSNTTYDVNKLVSEHALATLTVDSVAIRQNSPNGAVIKRVNTGFQFEYYYKVVANGHRWVVNKDKTQFMAISNSETQGKELWATFSEVKEEAKPTPTPTEKPTEKVDYTKYVKGYGVDVSEHNTDINVSKYDFVIIRACYGENTDEKFESFVKACESANVPYGVYVYDYALNDDEAKAEANYILNLIKDKDIQMGVWFDMEDADGYKKKNGVLTKERCTNSCKIFCDILKEKGYYTGVYTSTSWIGTYVDTDYPLWIANWGTNDGTIQSDQSDKAVIYQYTSNPLDKDVIYHGIDFYQSNPKKEEIKKDDSKNDKINVNGINQIIALILKILKKVLKLFK